MTSALEPPAPGTPTEPAGTEPAKLGRYRLQGELSRGAMGVVFKALDEQIGRTVAIKTVRRDLVLQEDREGIQLARFKREATAAGRLHHPCIVAIYDYGEEERTAYIAMEYIDGHSLRQLLEQGQRFPVNEAARLMIQLLSALAYSHRHGIIHRDIKPANLMLTRSGTLKITDFGIARIESSSLTMVGTVLGTPAYMPPEQFRGDGADLRCDLYSAGAVMFELLTGQRPFLGSVRSVEQQVMTVLPQPPSQVNPALPPVFDAVIARALAKDPDQRYQSAQEFLEAVREAEASLPPAPALTPDDDDDDRTLVSLEGLRSASRAPASPAEAPPLAPAQPPAAPGADHDETVRLGQDALPRPAAPLRKPEVPAPGRPRPSDNDPDKDQEEKRPKRRSWLMPASAAATVLLLAGGGLGWWLLAGRGPGPAPLPPAASPTAPPAPVISAPSATPQPTTPAVPATASTGPAAAPAGPLASGPQSLATPPAEPPAVPVAPAPLQDQPPSQPPPPLPAATALPPPPVPPPAPPPRASLGPALEQLRGALERLPCALLQAGAGADGGLLVSGWIGGDDGLPAVAAAAERAAAGLPYQVAADSLSPLLCGPLATTEAARKANQQRTKGLKVAPDSPDGHFTSGQHLLIAVDGPDFASFLQVDYFTLEGFVVHLLPNPTEANHRLGAGVRRDLGQARAGGRFWVVGPPFGHELVLATASSAPLFAVPRPEIESAERYLLDLKLALAAQKPGTPLVSAAAVITSQPE